MVLGAGALHAVSDGVSAGVDTGVLVAIDGDAECKDTAWPLVDPGGN